MRRLYNRHHKDAPPNSVYIGRGTPWGNPYVVGTHGAVGECVKLFEENTLPNLDVSALIGKTLVCSCWPRACHGNSILSKVEEIETKMADQISGVVQEVIRRSLNNGKSAFDIVVAGDKYGAGLFAPKCKEGDFVTFDVQYNGNFKNVERGTLKVSANKPANTGSSTPSQNVRAASNSFDARQDAISRQAASNTAIAWINLLHTAGALPIAASKSKGSQQEALDTIRRQYEKEFYEGNTGVEWKNISPNKANESDAEETSEEEENDPWS